MKFHLIITATLLICSSALANKKIKPLETYDIYSSPFVGLSSGTYKAGDIDKGDQTNVHYGVRAGFKVGPILFGAEFSAIETTRSSDQTGISDANLIKYGVDKSGSIASVGVNLGVVTDRVTFMATYFPTSRLEIKNDVPENRYTNTYDGSGLSAEINFRVWNRLYVGVYGSQSDFSEYSTDHSSGTIKDAELNPKLKMMSSGIMISYLVPMSELSKLSIGSKGSKK